MLGGVQLSLTADDVSELTALIYAAALDPAKWNHLLDRVAQKADGVRTQLFGQDFESGLHLGIIYSGYDPAGMESFGAYYHAFNDWAKGFIKFDAGIPLSAEQMCARDELEKGEFYNDWVRKQDDIVAGGGMMIYKDESRMFAFGGNIRRRDETREGEWMELVALLGPHFRQAFEISRKLSGMSIEALANAEAGARQTAVLLIDGNGLVLYANPAAEALSARGSPIAIGTNRAAKAADPALAQTLERARVALAENLPLPPVQFRFGSGDRAFDCHIAVVNPADIADLRISLLTDLGAPCLLLTLSPPAPGGDALDALCRRHGLTIAECAVLRQFAAGIRPDIIAESRATSLTTVRNQIKSIMAKTETHRQSDLLRLVMAARERT